MNKFQKVMNQTTKDTLSKEIAKNLVDKLGWNKSFRNMRMHHREEIKRYKVGFDVLLEFKKYQKGIEQ